MMTPSIRVSLLLIAAPALSGMLLGTTSVTAATPSAIFQIWPEGQMPGQARVDPGQPEKVITDRRRPFYQLTNISIPTVSVFLADEKTRSGGAVLVCPGGGLQRLAYEHEGLEIADWLNPLGISVFVLKYRVPAPSATALLDAQRALGLIRQRSAEFKIDPERISAMGFSAGAEVALLLAVNSPGRSYEPIDAADKLSCRPSNVCLLYAGGIARGSELRADIRDKLDSRATPSMFVVHAFGDSSDNSLALAAQLKRVGIPSEIHIYQEGGHGFGARDSALPLNGWKTGYLQWIGAEGFFVKPHLIAYADELAASLAGKTTFPPLSAAHPEVTLAEANAVQRRFVSRKLRSTGVLGYKAVIGAQSTDRPLTGILFRAERIEASAGLVVTLEDFRGTALQPQIGYVVSSGVDISTRIHKVEHIKGAFEAVVPVVELPINLPARMIPRPTEADQIAANLGSGRYIVGKSKVSPDDFSGEVRVTLMKDGVALEAATVRSAPKRVWLDLIAAVNEIVDQGYALHSGDLVVCGPAGQAQPAQPGKYSADFGALGTVGFELKQAPDSAEANR